MLSRKTIGRSTVALLLSVVGVSLLSLVISRSAAAGVVEAELRVAPPLHPVTRSNVDAPQAGGVLTDTTVADFQAGARLCYVAPSAGSDLDGELILTPTIGITFTDSVLPAGWYTGTYAVDGAVTISNGLLTAVGAYAAATSTSAPSQTLEFSATFGAAQGQHVGLTTSSDLNGGSWAIFSTGPSGDKLYARTSNVGAFEDTALGSQYLGTAHRYQIAWTDTNVTYSIDGNVVSVNSTVPISTPYTMRPIVSNAGSGALAVDWLRMSPYRTSCTFQSRVLDAGGSVTWLDLNSIVTQPAGTGIGIFQTRTGMTSTVDGSWSSFAPVSGTAITSPKGRYIVYRVTLTTTTANRAQTPVVERVTLSYTPLTVQTIDFKPLANKTYGDPPFTVVATATSGLPVTFTASGTCNSSGANGATVTLTGAGSCTVTAHQAGNDVYYPAPDVPQAFNIAKVTPVITWSNPANIVYGTPLGGTQLNATASVPGSWVYTPPAGTLLNAGANQILHVDFTPTDAANYNLASKEVLLTVLKANQTITFDPLPDKVIGDPPFVVAATASSGLSVTFTASGDCSIAGSTVTLLRAGTCTVTARQAGNVNYNAAPNVPRTFTIKGFKLFLPFITKNSP